MLYHVVAMDERRIIGKENKLPWHFSSDLKHFKQLTMGQTVIMGRKTFESIGRPLPERKNFVLSRATLKNKPGIQFFNSVDSALAAVETRDAFIIGGSAVYEQTIRQMDGLYVTVVHARYDGDVFYPKFPPEFKEKTRHMLQQNPLVEVVFLENINHTLHQIHN